MRLIIDLKTVLEDLELPEYHFEFDREEIVIGRGEACQVVLPSKSVSSKHTVIQRRSNYFFIVDLESTNGTYVNGERLKPHEKVRLKDNDVIKIAGYVATIGIELSAEPENAYEKTMLAPELQEIQEQLRQQFGAAFGTPEPEQTAPAGPPETDSAPPAAETAPEPAGPVDPMARYLTLRESSAGSGVAIAVIFGLLALASLVIGGTTVLMTLGVVTAPAFLQPLLLSMGDAKNIEGITNGADGGQSGTPRAVPPTPAPSPTTVPTAVERTAAELASYFELGARLGVANGMLVADERATVEGTAVAFRRDRDLNRACVKELTAALAVATDMGLDRALLAAIAAVRDRYRGVATTEALDRSLLDKVLDELHATFATELGPEMAWHFAAGRQAAVYYQLTTSPVEHVELIGFAALAGQVPRDLHEEAKTAVDRLASVEHVQLNASQRQQVAQTAQELLRALGGAGT
ncbi:MAG: FHA domain-containing protein [Candidatus Schekmanbacteria bacterium]|nr:FHA domain-containing protein [Candidatus Schekmanbacteria bacterium]